MLQRFTESTPDVGVLVRRCLAYARPALPPSCMCKTRVQAQLSVHVDLTLLAEALALLINAASLRLHDATSSNGCPRLSLRVRGREGRTIVRLAYSAPRRTLDEAGEHEERAFKIFESLGSSSSIRGTKRWSIFHITFPVEAGVDSRPRYGFERT